MQNFSTTQKILIAVLAVVLPLTGAVAYQSADNSSKTVDQATSTKATSTKEIALATSTVPLTPSRLQIPKIDVDAAVESVGVNAAGEMAVPSDWRNVSWYQPGYAPGERGNAVFSGHLDWKENQAVFWDLNKLRTGDVVQVVGEDRRLTYMVTGRKEYDYQVTDTTPIFGESDISQIKLITCDGEFMEGSDTYEKRLIVTAQLIENTADGSALPTSTKSVDLENGQPSL